MHNISVTSQFRIHNKELINAKIIIKTIITYQSKPSHLFIIIIHLVY